jgi:hypothetical protein
LRTKPSCGWPANRPSTPLEEVLKSQKSNLTSWRKRDLDLSNEDPKAFSDKMHAIYNEAAQRIGSDIVEQARSLAAR